MPAKNSAEHNDREDAFEKTKWVAIHSKRSTLNVHVARYAKAPNPNLRAPEELQNPKLQMEPASWRPFGVLRVVLPWRLEVGGWCLGFGAFADATGAWSFRTVASKAW